MGSKVRKQVTVHYAVSFNVACGQESATEASVEESNVTCGRCKRSKAFKDATKSGVDILADMLSLDGKTPAKITTTDIPTRVVAEDMTQAAKVELFERAKSLGYTDASAAQVADCFDTKAWENPCPKHPAHSTTMRNGYLVDDCEACEVIAMSDNEGWTAQGWEVTKAERAAENARFLAEECDAMVAHLTAVDCTCGEIMEGGARNLPYDGTACLGCGSLFTEAGREASEFILAVSEAVVRRNQVQAEALKAAKRNECEACHDAPATKTLAIGGAFVGSSSPSSNGAEDNVRLCDADYRAALATVNTDGRGVVYVYWHAERVVGQSIRFDREHCTRYVSIGANQTLMLNDARRQARLIEPGYAPTITGNGFDNPNAQRAYLVTRKGMDEVMFMTRAKALGSAWRYRYVDGSGRRERDFTFKCVEIDPVTGAEVEIVW